MEISPAENKHGGSVEDVCRICQSPEEPDNPLRHPCACRGSLKYVHMECLLLWLDRRKCKHCEFCKRGYTIVPVYSENAPERLPCHEFLMRLLLRVLRLLIYVILWVLMIPFNAYCFSLRPWKRESVFMNQRVFELSLNFPGLFNTAWTVISITQLVFIMVLLNEFIRRHPVLLRHAIILENGLRERDVTGVLFLILNHLQILCVWWHDQLLQLPFFHIFQMGPFAQGFVPQNTPLHEFGAIRRFFSPLNDYTFAIVAINIYWSFLDVLLPYSVGRVVLFLLHCCPNGWISDNVSEVTVGQMVLQSVILAYFGNVFILTLNTSPTRVRWLLPSVKDTFICCFKIGVLPWILGCWLDFCTFPISGTTVSHRLKALSDYPLMAAIHWHIGLWYLLIALRCMELIQKMVQKRAFWYLLDVTEPNYKISKLHLRPTLLAFAFHGAVMVIVLHLPIKTLTFISQSFFPFKFGVYDREFVLGLLVGLCLAYTRVIISGPWWLTNFITPSIKPIVHKWVIIVSSWLKLNDFLLGVPQRDRVNHNVRPLFRAFGIAEGSLVNLYGTQSYTTCEDVTNNERVKRFMLRIGVMLVLAALSMFLVSMTFLALPTLVGRTFFHSISFFMLSFGLKHDDLHAYLIGYCILRGIYLFTCFFYDHIVTGRIDLLLKHVIMFIRNVLLFSIWITVIPGLLGLLIELIILTPSQVMLDRSPLHILLYDWLIGVIVLHIWIFLTMFTRINCFATVAWREKLQKIRSIGINQLPFAWLIRDVIGSIIVSLLITLCVPYVLVNSLLPILGFSSAVNLTIKRFIWPGISALIPIWFSAKLTRALIIYLHRVEYNNRYKVGVRLVDFSEDLE